MISGVKQWQKDLISDTDSQFDQIGIMDLNIPSEEAPGNLLDAPLASTIPSLGEELTTRLTPQTQVKPKTKQIKGKKRSRA